MNRILLIVAGFLAVALVALASFYLFARQSAIHEVETKKPLFEKKETVDGNIPSGFPKDLPIEFASETKQSFEATAKDGRKQSTLKTTTVKTFPQVLETYTSFFISQGWKDVTPKEAGSAKIAMFRKDNSVLVLEFTVDEITNKNLIDLTLTESVSKTVQK